MNKSALVAVAAALAIPAAWGAITTSPEYAPTGTHLQSGTPSCSPDGFIVRCSTYELAGVGNTNASASLEVTYIATVICTNPAGNVAPGQTKPANTRTSTGDLAPKNGRLTVPALSSTSDKTYIEGLLMANTTCPNIKWTKSVQPDSLTVMGYTYTLHFYGYDGNYIVITG